MNLATAYRLVCEVASPSESEGLKKPRAILLLWFLRNVLGIDDLDAYEYICDGDRDQGVDALYNEASEGRDENEHLLLLQSKYPERAKDVGVRAIREFIGVAEPFRSPEALEELILSGVEPELHRLIERFDVAAKLRQQRIELRLVFVTAGRLTAEARRLVKSTNATRGPGFLKAYDALDLAPAIEAFRSPRPVVAQVKVRCDRRSRFVSAMPEGRVVVGRVPVADIVKWPGIEDRTLFDLNVRRELKRNQVRKALDRAIARKTDHPNFIAYHNGLTVVCKKVDDTRQNYLIVTDLSVVNGAQSTVAFKENEDAVSDELCIVVKFVEVRSEQQLAREVAIRSNTQNPVTPRNLRARDGIQLRLEREFAGSFPDIVYELRPDATIQPSGKVIQNDDAAQLLCAVYNEAPWIAIRRLSLFDSDHYPTIFTRDISAAHVVMADLIGERVQAAKTLFPREYLRSWRLTKLVGVYLVGQMLRTDRELEGLLRDPVSALANRTEVVAALDRLTRFAAGTLKIRQDTRAREGQTDDFKVDFKREAALKELAGRARDYLLMQATVACP